MDKTSNIVLDLNAKPMHNPTETPQYDEVIEELNRMKRENKKLNEILTGVCRDYHDLSKRKKRKFDQLETSNHSCCCCCCDECSPREINSNISRVHVRIDPSRAVSEISEALC